LSTALQRPRSAIWPGESSATAGGCEQSIGRSTTLAPWLNAENRKHQKIGGGSRMSEHVFCALALWLPGACPLFNFALGSARSRDAERRERFMDGRMPHVLLNRGRSCRDRRARTLECPARAAVAVVSASFSLCLFAETMRGVCCG